MIFYVSKTACLVDFTTSAQGGESPVRLRAVGPVCEQDDRSTSDRTFFFRNGRGVTLKLDRAYEAVIRRVHFDDASETPADARGVVVADENNVVDLKVASLVVTLLPLVDCIEVLVTPTCPEEICEVLNASPAFCDVE